MNLVGVVPARHNRQVAVADVTMETEMHRAQITIVFLVLTESGEGALGNHFRDFHDHAPAPYYDLERRPGLQRWPE